MKVWYPGPGVTGSAAKENQSHPDAGLIVVGENEIGNEALAQRLIASGLVADKAPDDEEARTPEIKIAVEESKAETKE